jgi:hypothetical protein
MWNGSETSGTSPMTAELADSELAEEGQGADARPADRASRPIEGGAMTVEASR